MGTDARVRYTKMIIQVNFISLLKQKPLNKITVKEICALSEINRATFYKYYADAYDLMEKIENEIIQELRETMENSIHDGINKTLIRILEKMKEHCSLYVTLFSNHGDISFPIKIFRICYGEFESYIHKKYPNLSETQREWIYTYAAQGSSGILNCWISDGLKEAPADVAKFIEQLISSTLNNF